MTSLFNDPAAGVHTSASQEATRRFSSVRPRGLHGKQTKKNKNPKLSLQIINTQKKYGNKFRITQTGFKIIIIKPLFLLESKTSLDL